MRGDLRSSGPQAPPESIFRFVSLPTSEAASPHTPPIPQFSRCLTRLKQFTIMRGFIKKVANWYFVSTAHIYYEEHEL